MPISTTSETARTIYGLCKEGKTAAELSGIMEIKRSALSWYLTQLIKDGWIYRGGAGKDLVYFRDSQQAKEYTVEASERLAKSKAATAEKKRLQAAERGRKAYAKKKAEQEKQEMPKVKKEAKKPVRIDLAMRDSGLVIATKQQEIDHKRFRQQANVIWPEGVKVTIIPTGVDTRFMAFVEPGKGQISRDWMANRKLSART